MIRFGLIGPGNIGKVHIENLASGRVRGGELTAVCGLREPTIELAKGVRYFRDVDTMLDSGCVDAAIVATPHPSHRPLGEKVLNHGLHLMMEKPLAATKLDGERLLAVPRHPGQMFGVMMNLRVHPHFQRIKGLLDSGYLGDFQRVQWTITNWFRSEAYYSMSNWRATWKGEGGGVLINQALHNLDLLQWLCGMPKCLRAYCEFGRDHDVEVEDHVVAYMNFDGGATGVFTASTGEAPGVNRLEIAGSKGLILFENNKLVLRRNDVDVNEYSVSTDDAFGAPAMREESIALEEEVPSHAEVLSRFVEAIEGKGGLLADASEGLKSVELANAMVYSTWKNEMVGLPLDSTAYESALADTIAKCPPRSRVVRVANVDLSKSYS